jgi:hypothetical protein
MAVDTRTLPFPEIAAQRLNAYILLSSACSSIPAAELDIFFRLGLAGGLKYGLA